MADCRCCRSAAGSADGILGLDLPAERRQRVGARSFLCSVSYGAAPSTTAQLVPPNAKLFFNATRTLAG